jgi:hypothetical protein
MALYYNSSLKRDDYVLFYVVKTFKRTASNSSEIAETQWFDLKSLPKDASKATKNRVSEYLGIKSGDGTW